MAESFKRASESSNRLNLAVFIHACKSAKRQPNYVDKTNAATIKSMLPYA